MEELLAEIYERVGSRPGLAESEVTDVFTDFDFFRSLGYEGIPVDVRSEKHITGGNRPDYFARDGLGNVVFVVEFKRPGRGEDLGSHLEQLWDRYVGPLGAEYGVLTDGQELLLFERDQWGEPDRLFRRRLDDLTESDVAALARLRKPDRAFGSIEDITAYFDEISVDHIETALTPPVEVESTSSMRGCFSKWHRR